MAAAGGGGRRCIPVVAVAVRCRQSSARAGRPTQVARKAGWMTGPRRSCNQRAAPDTSWLAGFCGAPRGASRFTHRARTKQQQQQQQQQRRRRRRSKNQETGKCLGEAQHRQTVSSGA